MSKCSLSPSASAFSSILSAFVGSVINGLTNGWLVAFMTGWISWFAVFRVLVGGLYMFFRSITDSWGPGRGKDYIDPDPPSYPLYPLDPRDGDTSTSTSHLVANNNNQRPDDDTEYYAYPAYLPGQGGVQLVVVPKPKYRQLAKNIWPAPSVVRGIDQPAADTALPTHPFLGRNGKKSIFTPRADLDRSVAPLGWISLLYTALWAPITQVLFLAANLSRPDGVTTGLGAAKLVKGLTVAVTALPLCIDCRVRYADSLRWKPGRYALNLFVGTSCLFQGAVCATLLISGLVDMIRDSDSDRENGSSRTSLGGGGGRRGFPILAVVGVIYVLFALVWMFGSFAMLPMRDGGRKGAGKTHWAGYLLDVGVGAFAGVFLAAPAIALYVRNSSGFGGSGMEDLADYLSCEEEVWRKIAAILP